jgi:hypothetical protein
MLELADALAELKSLVMHPGNWSRLNPLPHQTEHVARYQAASTRLHKLIEEISYDKETRTTAVDFEHLCGMVVEDLFSRRDYRVHWNELEKISGPIFHRLHRGRGIKRSKIPWPQWVLDNDARAKGHVIDTASRTAAQEPPAIAEARAIARELDGRLAYVKRVMNGNEPGELRNWRDKIELQRVPFADLRNAETSALTRVQAERVRTVIRALDELERAIELIAANPDQFKLAHSAGIYRQRANKARIMLSDLFKATE